MKLQSRRRSSISTEQILSDLDNSILTIAQYDHVLVRLTIDRSSDENNLIFGRIDYLCKGDPLPKAFTNNYDDLIISQFVISQDELRKFFSELTSNKTSEINSLKVNTNLKNYWELETFPSNHAYGYVRGKFPYQYYATSLEYSKNRDPYAPVTGKNLVPFPSTSRAIIDLLDLHHGGRGEGWLNEYKLILCVPDYRVGIKKIKIGKNKISVEINSKLLNDEDLISQFYTENEQEASIPIKNGIAEISCKTTPKQILVIIKDKKSDEVLDYFDYTVRWAMSEDAVEKEIPEDIVHKWINEGENENVEFKEVLKHADDVMKTVVAFANTNGGAILVGVKDDCSIIGYNESVTETKERFGRMVAEKCDPPIDFEIKQVDLGEKITIITIPKGKNKIYAVTNGGIYLRRNSSDRFIKPSELNEIFGNENKSNSTIGL